MSEFSFPPNTPKKTQKTLFSTLILSYISIFCSLILSHPLYFSYLIYFLPYLLKLLSFLSPLFITTFLLLITLLTISPNLLRDNSLEFSESKLGFLLTTYQHVLEKLQSNVDDEDQEFPQFEELEAYKIVFEFEMSAFEIRENPIEDLELKSEEAPVDKHLIHGGNVNSVSETLVSKKEENSVQITKPEIAKLIVGGNLPNGFLEDKHQCENFSSEKEEKESKVILCSKTSNAKDVENGDNHEMGSNLGSYGSMRKEKEWKRTLACKLFEERHNADGVEGMDMLWETYETQSIKAAQARSSSTEKKGKKNYEDDEEDEEVGNEQLCCLQALKFSAGKMNLGLGRPNLVKISKALKGIGWLHNVTRHSKKGYH